MFNFIHVIALRCQAGTRISPSKFIYLKKYVLKVFRINIFRKLIFKSFDIIVIYIPGGPVDQFQI